MLFGKIATELKVRLNCGGERSNCSLIISPFVGGIILGLIGWYLPLTIGDGQEALSAIMGDGYENYWKRQE